MKNGHFCLTLQAFKAAVSCDSKIYCEPQEKPRHVSKKAEVTCDKKDTNKIHFFFSKSKLVLSICMIHFYFLANVRLQVQGWFNLNQDISYCPP